VAWTSETERLVARLRADLAQVTDQQTRDLVSAWVDAWNEVHPDLTKVLVDMLTAGDKITRTALLRSERLLKVLRLIAGHLEQLSEQARVRIIGDLQTVIDIAGGAQASVIDSQLPRQTPLLDGLQSWTRVDNRAVEAIVRRTTQQITKRTRPLSADAEKAVRRELVRGYAAGASPRATAARIVARTEGRFNGGLNRALAIARTETLDASRHAAQLGREQHADVLQGWSWHCSLSSRTCPACIARDGSIHSLSEPGPDDHVNGRCTAVPITKSWADLGLDIDEPASTRVTGADWFATLDQRTQQQILGPARYTAWQAGTYPMDAWGEVRANPGWRTSLQTTRPPAAGQSGGRAAS
jgi:hypothetical protein